MAIRGLLADGGKAMRKMIFCLVMLLVITMPAPGGIAAAAAAPISFSDVPSTAWYLEDLQYLLENADHIFSGYPDGTFRPNEPLTIDMFIKLTVTALGEDPETGGDYWASTYIRKAFEKSLVRSSDGFPDPAENLPKSYEPYKKPITRETMALITGRALDYIAEETPYRDPLQFSSLMLDYNKISSHAKSNVIKCYDLGILTGFPDGEFKPQNRLTRAEAVSVIRRLIDPGSRKAVAVNPAPNPSPTPIPVTNFSRPEKKDLGKGIFEVEGIRIDPSLDYIRNSGGVMSILKAEEFVDVALKSLRFYEFNGKARMRGYIPQLPDGYIWSFNMECGVKQPNDRGVYGGIYTSEEEEQPEYRLPPAGNAFDVSLYTNKENISRLVLTCEILTADGKSGGKITISFTENKYTTDDFYGGFDGTYPFDSGPYFEWHEENP